MVGDGLALLCSGRHFVRGDGTADIMETDPEADPPVIQV